jgi:hypothetical protein
MGDAFTVRAPNLRAEFARLARENERNQLRIAAIVTDRTAKEYQRLVKHAIVGANLGKLGGAVKEKRISATGGYGPSAVVYAAGGDQSLAGGALESYTQGAIIQAQSKTWLAFATSAIPSRVGRFRMTPARYNAAGYNQSLGKLVFVPVNSRLALLVVKNTTQHVRTGRIKLPGKRASKVYGPQKSIVVFVLIKQTIRTKRFDTGVLAEAALANVPAYVAEAINSIYPND